MLLVIANRFLAVTALAGYVAVAAQAAKPVKEWTSAERFAAVHGCREAILDQATRDYLARHNLSQAQLPTGFRQRIAPAVEPYLLTCDCMVNVLSSEVSLESFNASTQPVQMRIKNLISPGGVCAAKTGT